MYIDPTLFEMENIIEYKLENTPYIIFVPFNGNSKWMIFFLRFPSYLYRNKKDSLQTMSWYPGSGVSIGWDDAMSMLKLQ